MSEALKASIYRDLDTPAAIWDSLAQDSRIYAFQTRHWLSVWQNTIGNAHGVVPCIIVFEKGQNTALFPLGKKKVRFGTSSRTMLIWLGYGVSDYCAAIFLQRGTVRYDRALRPSQEHCKKGALLRGVSRPNSKILG